MIFFFFFLPVSVSQVFPMVYFDRAALIRSFRWSCTQLRTYSCIKRPNSAAEISARRVGDLFYLAIMHALWMFMEGNKENDNNKKKDLCTLPQVMLTFYTVLSFYFYRESTLKGISPKSSLVMIRKQR